MDIKKDLSALIGHTPLFELNRIEQKLALAARVLVKLESANPTGSVKDRAALGMIAAAEADGKLRQDSIIIEPTSGNTGIGLTALGASKGYRVILTMPETMSLERRKLLKAYGAEIVLTPGPLGMKGAIAKAQELANTLQDSLVLGQFDNPANPEAHYQTTGPEIWADCDGAIDVFVAGVGTGGTLTGVGRFLKEKNAAVQVVAVEPEASAVLSGKAPGPHKIQGIGAGFVPANLDAKIHNQILTVSDQEAMEKARLLASCEGLLVGISSGAALAATLRLAQKPDYRGKTFVTVLPDSGDRYLSTELFAAEDQAPV